VTKAKAIETLNIGYDGCVKLRKTLRDNDDNDNADYLNDLLIALLTAIDVLKQSSTVEAESVNGWINMKDRRPEPETWVLVYIEYYSPVVELERGIQKTNSIKKMFYDGESFYCDFGVITHWMPLPTPPKEVDAE
jgi:hypothetical protein